MVIVWGDSFERLLRSSLGSIFPCLTFSIFSSMSLFCFSISFFMTCLWSSNCYLSRWICSALLIFSSIFPISFSFSYSWTFMIRSTFYFLSVRLIISSLCFSSIFSYFSLWTRTRFSYFDSNLRLSSILYCSICFSLFSLTWRLSSSFLSSAFFFYIASILCCSSISLFLYSASFCFL